MDVNSFIKTSQEQLLSFKMKEAINFAYATAEKDANYAQMKILCLFTAADAYYFKAGDGENGKAWCKGLLNYLDENIHIISDVPSLREAMEDIYIKMCEIVCDAAISYDEYFQYMNKITSIRPHNDFQRRQIKLIEAMQEEGQSWSNNMLYLAAKYAGTNVGSEQTNTEHGPAASLYGLVLQDRRSLRISRSDLKMIMSNYSACIGNLILSYAEYYKSRSLRLDPNNLLFIIEKAMAVINEAKNDLMEPNAGEDDLAYLMNQKEALLQLDNQNGITSFESTEPNASGIKDLAPVIATIMSSNLHPNALQKGTNSNPKAANGFSVLLQLVIAGGAWYLALNEYKGNWLLYAVAIFLSLVTVIKLLSWISSKSRK